MAEGIGSIGSDGGGGSIGSFESAGPPAGGFETTLDEVSVVGDRPGAAQAIPGESNFAGGSPGGPPRQTSTSPSILAQQSILSQSQAGDAATAQTFATFQSQNAARADAAQSQFGSNQASLNASTSALFAGPTITGPILPPGGAFDLNGPVAPPGFQGEGAPPQAPAGGTDPALAAAGVAALPAEGALTNGLGTTFGNLAARAPSFGEALAFGSDVLGGLALRAAGLGGFYFGLGTGNIPNDAQESAMRLGGTAFDPTPLADQTAPLTPPTLTDGFTAPPPATLTPPTAFTPIPGAVAPLPGLTPAPALPGLEGLTPVLPGFDPLPGFAAAPPAGLAIPGFTPAEQTPALPGFGAADPGLAGPLISQNNGAPGVLTGSLSDLTNDERAFVQDRIGQGDNVTIVPRGAGRTPDFEINGVRTELKTVSGIRNQTEAGLSSAISNRILNARGQSGTIVIDARQQPGMTTAAAERALARAFFADAKLGAKLVQVTVLTPNGPVERKR